MKKISALLNHLSTKYTVKIPTATMVRKALASKAVLECSPSQVMSISKTMSHRIGLHKKYYETHSSKQSAVVASKIIRKIQNESGSEEQGEQHREPMEKGRTPFSTSEEKAIRAWFASDIKEQNLHPYKNVGNT